MTHVSQMEKIVKSTSLYSSTMIGAPEQLHSYRNDVMRIQYQNEAKQITNYMKTIHPYHKSSMQVNYENTLVKLHQGLSKTINRPNTNENTYRHISNQMKYSRSQTSHQTRQSNMKNIKLKQFEDKFNQNMKQEVYINTRKRLYNQECSKSSVASDIMRGIAPMPKHLIFPQRATHDQILAMTGNRVAKNVNIIPPDVQKSKRWLGEDIGWEGQY